LDKIYSHNNFFPKWLGLIQLISCSNKKQCKTCKCYFTNFTTINKLKNQCFNFTYISVFRSIINPRWVLLTGLSSYKDLVPCEFSTQLCSLTNFMTVAHCQQTCNATCMMKTIKTYSKQRRNRYPNKKTLTFYLIFHVYVTNQ
jgi:hypothetical protein